MDAFFQLNDADGVPTLNSSDTALVRLGQDLQIVASNSSIVTQQDVMNSYIDAQTTAVSSGGVNFGTWVTFNPTYRNTLPRATAFWFRNLPGGEVFLADFMEMGDPTPNLNFGYRGASGRFLASAKQNLNQYAGYLNIYDEAGLLVWSAMSLGQAPRVLGVINIPESSRVNMDPFQVDLTSFGVDPNKMYYANPGNGRLNYDELFFDYTGVFTKRVGNILYILPGQRVGNVFPKNGRTVKTVFGQGGLYFPFAYFP